MRGDAFGFLGRAPGVIEFERAPIVDRREAATEADLAFEFEFLLGFVAGIDATFRLQLGECRVVTREPRGLAFLAVGGDPKPGEIGADRLDIILAAAFRIGIVDTQQKTPAALSP